MNFSSIRLLLAAIVIVAGSLFPAAAQEPAHFNVATYNLRLKNSGDSVAGNNWADRAPVVAQLIRFHDFDIFGTQEGFKSQLEDLKAMLPGFAYTGVARDDGHEQGEHSAIFYDTNKFELLDHGDFWLSETPDKPGLGWDAVCIRICSWGKFRHKPSGRIFQFYNLHMDHVGKVARSESVKLVLKKMAEVGYDLPTFLTGDFNVDQTDPLYHQIQTSDHLKDSYTRADFTYALNGTFNAYKADGHSNSRIDHIFVTDNVNVEKYGVLTDSYRTAVAEDKEYQLTDFPAGLKLSAYRTRLPSDHYPVKIKVSL